MAEKKKSKKKSDEAKEEPAKEEKKAEAPSEEKAEAPREVVKAEPIAELVKVAEKRKELPAAGKIFGVWDMGEVMVTDPGLKAYINLTPYLVIHTYGRHASRSFYKNEISIVERLINAIMRSGSKKKVGGHRIATRMGCGKKSKAYNAVKEAFDIINKRTKQNPVQVLVLALESSSPREETTRVKYGGITRHIAVDISPQRRVDFALRNIAVAALAKAFKSRKSRGEALAEEIIAASKEEATSMAIAKKNEVERVARGAR
jgi:small subunit ribosomal protein S7